jgi:hypothetical protein
MTIDGKQSRIDNKLFLESLKKVFHSSVWFHCE